MKGLEIVGPFRGSTGHDRHTREVTRQLVKRGVPVQLTQLHGWSPDLPAAARDSWFDCLCAQRDTDVALHFAMPTLCTARRGKINVNYTMFEADRLPRPWVACASMHERIIVPTRACVDTWTASGVAEEKLRVAPFGVDADFFSEDAPPLPISMPNGRPLASYRHRFLNIGDLRPRKNHLGLLRTWLRATCRTDDAALVMKLSNDSRFHADVAGMQRQLGRSLHEAAPVVFMTGMLSDHELRSLYRSATCYLSMSCGEGWDFPMTESAAALDFPRGAAQDHPGGQSRWGRLPLPLRIPRP